jgi:hypothetical protein
MLSQDEAEQLMPTGMKSKGAKGPAGDKDGTKDKDEAGGSGSSAKNKERPDREVKQEPKSPETPRLTNFRSNKANVADSRPRPARFEAKEADHRDRIVESLVVPFSARRPAVRDSSPTRDVGRRQEHPRDRHHQDETHFRQQTQQHHRHGSFDQPHFGHQEEAAGSIDPGQMDIPDFGYLDEETRRNSKYG